MDMSLYACTPAWSFISISHVSSSHGSYAQVRVHVIIITT